MSKTTKTVISTLLVVMFGFFSIGVPVVQYLCPTMSSENPTCDMSPTANATGTSISTQTPACCAKQLGAERNTTPFLKVEKLQSISFDFSTAQVVSVEPVLSTTSFNPGNPEPHSSSRSLFDLHAALLI
ncbi:MAG: hypothetical protein HY562_07875 [Ignavibacteriales bacterium]|nr:hypothetical protein [Ignavibacteriales bacterium]